MIKYKYLIGVLCFVGMIFSPSFAVNTTPAPILPTIQAPPEHHNSAGIVNNKTSVKIKKIQIHGNLRVGKDKILQVLPLKIGDSITDSNLNVAIKNLYSTQLFKKVQIKVLDKNILDVTIQEFPIVHRIKFDGNSDVDTEALQQVITLKPSDVFSQDKLDNDLRNIQRLYNFFGHYSVMIDPKIKKLDENRVDITYQILEGEKTDIESIKFVGNKYYSDRSLREVIRSKEWAWYRFLSSNVVFDPQRLQLDKELLKDYYTQGGYADFTILNVAKNISKDGKGIYLTFTIFEGKRYSFGTLDLKSEISDIDVNKYKHLITESTGNWFNSHLIKETSNTIALQLNEDGYNFVDVKPKVDLDKEKLTANITYTIIATPKQFIDKIILRGNTRTQGEVIRRVLDVSAGDPVNYAKIRKSELNLYSEGFFKNAQISQTPSTSNDPKKVNLIANVAEAGTTNIFFSGGYSSVNGLFGQLQFSDRNILGTGNGFSSAFTITQKNISLSGNYLQPFFLDRPTTFNLNSSFVLDTSYTVSSYKATNLSVSPGLKYDLFKYWSQRAFYQIQATNIYALAQYASSYVREEKGLHVASIIGQTLTFDRRNNSYSPTSGYLLGWTSSFSGVGGNVLYLKDVLNGEYYYPITRVITAKLYGDYGVISGLGKKVLILNRFFLGGEDLRGFADGGVGPRDHSTRTKDFLGGTQMTHIAFAVSFPLGISKDFGLTGSIFNEWGTTWDTNEPNPDNYYDAHGKLRGDVGFGLHWLSPIGLLTFSWAFPVAKQAWDETQLFRFSVGGQF